MRYLTLLVAALALTSCASIVSDTRYPIKVKTYPQGAHCTITDDDGNIVAQQVTPFTYEAQSGVGYFDANKLHFDFYLDGHDDNVVTLDTKLDPWYLGNLVLGGLVGLFLVDPLTGAMFEFRDDEVAVSMRKSGPSPTLSPAVEVE